MTDRKPLIIAAAALLGLCCLAVFAVLVIAGLGADRKREQAAADFEATFAPLEAVCSGTPAPAAPAYQAGTGLHPTAIFTVFDTDTYNTNSDFPTTWQPAGVSNAQLVACIEQTQVLVESCDYDIVDDADNPTGETAVIERYFYQASVRLLEAQTGKQVDLGKFDGSQPKLCSDEVTFEEGQSLVTLYGSLVPDTDIETWLRPFVETP